MAEIYARKPGDAESRSWLWPALLIAAALLVLLVVVLGMLGD